MRTIRTTRAGVGRRPVPAVLAGLGLILSTLALAAAPADAEDYSEPAIFGPYTDGAGALSDTEHNGVFWQVNRRYIRTGDTMTFTFDQPVLVEFNAFTAAEPDSYPCSGEGVLIPEGASLVDEPQSDTQGNGGWDPDTRVLSMSPEISTEEGSATFTFDELITSFSVTGVGVGHGAEVDQGDCYRTIGGLVWAVEGDPPTVEINSPTDGASYVVGQGIPVDYSCDDAESDASEVSCDGDAANGDELVHSTADDQAQFSVTATDPHGGTTTATSTYAVVEAEGACQATAVGVGAVRVVGANSASGNPCGPHTSGAVDLEIPLGVQLPWPLDALNGRIELRGVQARTDDHLAVHSAEAKVAELNIYYPLSNWSLEAKFIHSSASAAPSPDGCDAPPVLKGNAETGTWIQNGREHKDLDRTKDWEIPGVAVIRFNDVTETEDSVVSRVLMIDLPGDTLDIVIGESEASIRC